MSVSVPGMDSLYNSAKIYLLYYIRNSLIYYCSYIFSFFLKTDVYFIAFQWKSLLGRSLN